MPDSQDRRSKVLTLVFTDLADSTALKTRQGDSAIETLISRHAAHIERLAAECGGRIIDWAGDGCFLTFETSSSAVLFALRLQQAHAEEQDLPGVRIGIHMGEVTESATSAGAPHVAGLAVDLASRISGLARPGQVLMSAAVYDSARQRIGVESLGQPILWQAHGTYALKGFDKELEIGEAGMQHIAPLTAPTSGDKARLVRRAKHPAPHTSPARAMWTGARRFLPLAIVVAALLGAAYLAGQFKTGTASDVNGPITSLAVLPLENLSGDTEQEYFADGMTEAIIAELSKIKALKVISRTSVMQYKGTTKTMPEIASDLGVDGLIEGSVLRDGDDVRITVQLIHGPTDAHVWTQSYEQTITSVLKLQSDVALAIAREIGTSLSPDEQSRVETARVVDPDAYENYLLGSHFRELGTRDALDEAITYFEKAIEIDPAYAEAWARLSLTYLQQQGWAYSAPRDVAPKARAAATKALELDPDLAEAHAALGGVAHRYDWEWEEAEQRMKRAIELEPNNARFHNDYAWLIVQQGRSDEALSQANLALDLDPNALWVRSMAAAVYTASGDPERALPILEESRREDPDHPATLQTLGSAYSELGEFDKAIEVLEHRVALTGQDANSRLGLAQRLASVGHDDEAHAILADVLSQQDSAYATQTGVAAVYATLGEFDKAFEYLERGFQDRDWTMNWLRIAPGRRAVQASARLQEYYRDPRYWSIIDRMNYPPLPPGHPAYANEQAWLAKKKAAADANAPIDKLAVLPFKNISGDPQQEFFVDGMTEALISELAKIKSIKVISRTSAMHYKDTTKTLPEIARELGVEGVIEGSAMKAGNEVRITAQLIRAATDEHLWAESFTNSMENVLQLQSEVALKIAGGVNAVVTPQETARIASAKPIDPEAYGYYLQGRSFWNQRTPEALEQAQKLIERAIEIEPNFALAHAGLADTLNILAQSQWIQGDPRIVRSRQEALRALELDPQLGEAYAALGTLAFSFEWNWAEAETAMRESIELSPGYASAHQWLGVLWFFQGRTQEAIASLQSAMELDPVSPAIAIWLAQTMAEAGQATEGLKLAEQLLETYGDNSRIVTGLVLIYARLGRFDDAIAMNDKRSGRAEYDQPLMKASLLPRVGRADEARAILNDVLTRIPDAEIRPFQVATVYAALNEADKAFEWLERGFVTRDYAMTQLKIARVFDSLHHDPRFNDLLRRMGLPRNEAKP